MSRTCNHLLSDGLTYCKQIVEDHHDHCEAGHPCPPVEAKAAEKNVGLHADTGSLDVDDLIVPQAGGSQKKSSQRVSDEMRGLKRLSKVVDSLGPKYKYLGTLRGTHKVIMNANEGSLAEIPHRLDIFEANKQLLMARGFVEANEHWYAVRPCTIEDCRTPAFIQLKNSELWYGKIRHDDMAFRRKVWATDIKKALSVETPLCQTHRAETVLEMYNAQQEKVLGAYVAEGLEQISELAQLESVLGEELELVFPKCPQCSSGEWSFTKDMDGKCKSCGTQWTIDLKENES